MADQLITAEEVFKAIQEKLEDEYDISGDNDTSFADIPTHNKMIFTQGDSVFIISISEGSAARPEDKRAELRDDRDKKR